MISERLHKMINGEPAPLTDEELILAEGKLHKVVMGYRVLLTPEEESAVRAEWGNLPSLKAIAHVRINADREMAMDAGVTFNLNVFDSDERSRENLTGTVSAVNAGIALPLGFTWRSRDNRDIPMTAADLVGLSAAMLQHVNGQYHKSWQLKARIDAATTKEEIDAVVWT